MYQKNNTIAGSLDSFDLNEFPLDRYFFILNNLPIYNSMNVFFDLEYNVISYDEPVTNFDLDMYTDVHFTVDDKKISNSLLLNDKFQIVKIIGIDEEPVEREEFKNIVYISYDSKECDEYSVLLIGKWLEDETGELVKVTSNNCTQFKKYLLDYCIIDFSLSEQICSILNNVDKYGKRVCNNFTVSYFYKL